MGKKINTELFKKMLFEKWKNEYTTEDEYINTQTKMKFKHSKCGNIVEIRPVDILQGYGCHFCNKKDKKTTEIFKKEVYEQVKDEYSVIGEYGKSNKESILVRHNTCRT